MRNRGMCKAFARGKDIRELCQNVIVYENINEWDKFWTSVVNVDNEKCCVIFDPGDRLTEDLKSEIIIPAGVVRCVEIRLTEGVESDMSLSFRCGENSSVGVKFVVDIEEDNYLDLFVKSVVSECSVDFQFSNRVVARGGSRVDVKTNGVLGRKARDSECRFDTKILQLGEAEVSGRPIMEVKCRDCDMDHGFSVDRVPQKVLKYMQTRGINERISEKLYVKGFLR